MDQFIIKTISSNIRGLLGKQYSAMVNSRDEVLKFIEGLTSEPVNKVVITSNYNHDEVRVDLVNDDNKSIAHATMLHPNLVDEIIADFNLLGIIPQPASPDQLEMLKLIVAQRTRCVITSFFVTRIPPRNPAWVMYEDARVKMYGCHRPMREMELSDHLNVIFQK